MINPQARLLVVLASSAAQEGVARFLEQAQANLQRQVILEAKTLEVQLSEGFQAGISWNQLGGEVSASLASAVLSGPKVLTGFGVR
jgi:MSHA biogenesis protein MshL